MRTCKTCLYQTKSSKNRFSPRLSEVPLDNEKTLKREIKALEEARSAFPKAKQFVVTKKMPEQKVEGPFQILPLWLQLTNLL